MTMEVTGRTGRVAVVLASGVNFHSIPLIPRSRVVK